MQIDEQEYQHLKEIERLYLQMVRDSPSETDTEPEQEAEAEAPTEAETEAETEAPAESEPEAETEVPTEPEPDELIAPGDYEITREDTFGKLDAWRVLNRLTTLCRVSGMAQETPNDNLAAFDGGACSYRFTANDYDANSAIKLEAKRVIWAATGDCDLLNCVRETRLETVNIPAEVLVQRLAGVLRQNDGLLLLAIIHRLSTQPHVHLLWMDRQGGERTLEELLNRGGEGHDQG